MTAVKDLKHLVQRCKYCKRRFTGDVKWRFHVHKRSHEKTIKPYWYKKKAKTSLRNGTRRSHARSHGLTSLFNDTRIIDESQMRSSSAPKSIYTSDSRREIIIDEHHSNGLPPSLSQEDTWDNQELGPVNEEPMTTTSPSAAIKLRFCDQNCQPTASKKSISTATDKKKKKRYHCQFCPRCFSQNGGLVIHERIHTGDKPFSCDVCDLTFYDKSNLRKHYRKHTGEKIFKCKHCAKEFADASNCKKHEDKHDGLTYKCTFCDMMFITKRGWRDHERIHTGVRPFPCKYCDKAFTRSTGRLMHERIHLGEKHHQCDFEGCSAAFIRGYLLKVHKRTHTGESVYKCDFCAKEYKGKPQKYRHERQCSDNPTADPKNITKYKCNFCDMELTTDHGRREHEMTRHKPEECPYACRWCKKPIASKTKLKKHEKIHIRREGAKTLAG